MNENCFENEEVLKVGASIIDVLTDCVKTKNWSKCLADLRSLNCTDIDNIIKLYVAMSKAKKDGTYEKTRTEILEIFRTFKIMDVKNFIKNILEPLINSLEQVNCLIDNINKEFQLDSTEQIDSYDLQIMKMDLITLVNSSSVKENYEKDVTPSTQKKNNLYLIISSIVMALMFFIIVYLLMKEHH